MTTEIANTPAPSFWASVRKWLIDAGWAFREGWNWQTIYDHHKRAGHPNPRLATEMEIYERGEYIERFRDLASEAWLRDKTDLDTVKADFIKERLSAKTTILPTDRTAALRAVIRDMGQDEAYHKPVFEAWKADQDQYLKDILAESEAIHGKGGYTPLERRVLRGSN